MDSSHEEKKRGFCDQEGFDDDDDDEEDQIDDDDDKKEDEEGLDQSSSKKNSNKKKKKMMMVMNKKGSCNSSSSSSSMKKKKKSVKLLNPNYGEGAASSAKSLSSSPNNMIRECDFCGRKFSSGKALGGHRRFHLQELRKNNHQQISKLNPPPPPHNNNNSLKNPNFKKPSSSSQDHQDHDDDDGGDDDDEKSSLGCMCCICKKYFPSKKSLFGHMRSHPEREWRGVNPPFHHHQKKLLEEEVRGEEQEQEQQEFPNGVVDLSISCSSSWFKKDKRGRSSIGAAEAAHNLVFLSSYGNNFPPEDKILKKRKNDDDEEIWKLKKVKLGNKKNLKKKKKKKLKEEVKKEEEEEEEDLLIKTLKEEGYECSICHKSFPTFQALGGHRSRHNKDKNIIINVRVNSNIIKESSTHEEEEEELSNEVGEASNKSSGDGSKILDFDLNEPYLMEDGDDNNNGAKKLTFSIDDNSELAS